MAYYALVSLANTIDRFLNSNLYSISLEEKQQITYLCEYVILFRQFLDEFPDEFNVLEGRMRDLANEAEDVLEYLVLEKVYLSSAKYAFDELYWPEELMDKFPQDFPDEANNGNISGFISMEDRQVFKRFSEHKLSNEIDSSTEEMMIGIYDDEQTHDKWRFLPAKFPKLKFDSIMGKMGKLGYMPITLSYFLLLFISLTMVGHLEELALSSTAIAISFAALAGFILLLGMASALDMKNNSAAIKEDTVQLGDSAATAASSSGIDDDDDDDDMQFGMASALDMKNNSAAIKEDMVQLGDSAKAAASSFGIYDDDDDEEEEEEEKSKYYQSAKHEFQLKIVLKRVMREIALIAAQVKKITHSSSSKDVERGSADYSSALSSSSTAPPTRKDSMVGFEDYVLDIKDRLCGEPSRLQVIPICGMGGIGKTTLARNLYDDPLILSRFDVRVWVTISQDYSAQRILSSLVESLKEFDTGRLGESNDEKVHKILMGRRFLVVMDDTWSSEAWDIVSRVFSDDGNGSRVMLTTRLFDVASYPDNSSKLYQMSLLNVDQSWNLFKQKVFADEDCPYELENIGKEITRSCKGLPLAIVVIAGLVYTAARSVASWQEIAKNVKSAETAEHDQIEEILCLSYIHLPQYLRPCFLYMASFVEDEEIHVNKLFRLWVAEGFVESPTDSCFEKVAEECLEKLVKRNLALVTKRKCDGRIKSCSLHDRMRDLCIRKAHESNFFLNFSLNAMDTEIKEERFMESIKNQRRVSIDPCLSRLISRFDGSNIHSIRVSKYKTSIGGLINLNFVKSVRLLRVLDAEPAQLVPSLSMDQLCKLFHLRFLAIRYSGSIPRGLSMLQNLQTLIICGEEFDVGLGGVLRLSWCTTQLRHVYFHGMIYFEDPQQTTSSLKSLQTLSYVTHLSCTERILKRLPNLKKLKIDCSEGCSSAHHHEDAAWLNDLVHLHRLENLEVDAGSWFQSRPKHYKITYPSMLKKLTLRDLRLPWSNILVVGSLPNLQVLKLKRCICAGGTWETVEGAFPVLEVLLIRCSSFKDWITESSHFPRLKRLLIDSCRDLNGIPSDIGEIPTLELIEVKGQEVKKSLVESVEQIQQEQEELANNMLKVICIAK